MPKTWQTPEERLEYNRRWFASEKGYELRKRVIIARACKNKRIPTLATMQKYNITGEELASVINTIQKEMN